MIWDVAKPNPDIESHSLFYPCFKQWATRQGTGGKESNLGAKGRKARDKDMKKSKLAEGKQ